MLFRSHKNNKTNRNIITSNSLDLNNSPSIFTKKNNKDIRQRPNAFVINTLGPTRHNPSSTKEWFNSIYTYNNNSMKDLPSLDKSFGKIIRSYFNSSLLLVYKNSKPSAKKRLKTRFKRLSLKNIFVGKPELKHTYDKVIITLFVFDGERNFLLKKFNNFKRIIFTNYKLFSLLKTYSNKGLFPYISGSSYLSEKNFMLNFVKPYFLKENLVNNKFKFKNISINSERLNFIRSNFFKNKLFSSYWKPYSKLFKSSMYNYQEKGGNFLLMKTKKFKRISDLLIFNSMTNNQFGAGDIVKKLSGIKKRLNREIRPYKNAVTSLIFNHNKFTTYILRLTPLISKLYGKKVEFNIIKLKYLYNNSDIFTQAIAIKLKNRDNKLLGVMRSALGLIRIPYINRVREIYGKDNTGFLWVNKVKNLTYDNKTIEAHLSDVLSYNDKTDSFGSELPRLVCNNLKYKTLTGARIEARGRLTRRFTASRSVFKVRWKGGLKNPDSRYKGISTVILRGHTTGNTAYSVVNSKTRNGAFGIKGWIAGK